MKMKKQFDILEDYKGQILKDFGFWGVRNRHLRLWDYGHLKTYFTFNI